MGYDGKINSLIDISNTYMIVDIIISKQSINICKRGYMFKKGYNNMSLCTSAFAVQQGRYRQMEL